MANSDNGGCLPDSSGAGPWPMAPIRQATAFPAILLAAGKPITPSPVRGRRDRVAAVPAAGSCRSGPGDSTVCNTPSAETTSGLSSPTYAGATMTGDHPAEARAGARRWGTTAPAIGSAPVLGRWGGIQSGQIHRGLGLVVGIGCVRGPTPPASGSGGVGPRAQDQYPHDESKRHGENLTGSESRQRTRPFTGAESIAGAAVRHYVALPGRCVVAGGRSPSSSRR